MDSCYPQTEALLDEPERDKEPANPFAITLSLPCPDCGAEMSFRSLDGDEARTETHHLVVVPLDCTCGYGICLEISNKADDLVPEDSNADS